MKENHGNVRGVNASRSKGGIVGGEYVVCEGVGRGVNNKGILQLANKDIDMELLDWFSMGDVATNKVGDLRDATGLTADKKCADLKAHSRIAATSNGSDVPEQICPRCR